MKLSINEILTSRRHLGERQGTSKAISVNGVGEALRKIMSIQPMVVSLELDEWLVHWAPKLASRV